MANLTINGGKPLTGKITVNSAKNSAVAILCATAMIEGKTILSEVPMIEEVHRIIEVLSSIGIRIRWEKGKHLEIVNDGKIKIKEIDKEAFLKTRSALLLMGALSTELKVFSLPKSGGCNLGKRTVNPYLIAMKEMGIKIKETNSEYQVDASKKKSASFTMYESGDTATENTIMAAVLTNGVTEINFASSNYMIQDLICYLKAAGANIEWSGINRLKITGVKKLKPVENYPIMPDPIESMAFISLAITTHSHLKIVGCPIDYLRLEIEKLKVMGQKLKISKTYKSKNKFFDLVDIEIIPSKLKALPDKIHPNPYPGLNIDNLPLFVPILTQAEGQTLVHDWVYENRAIYYIELNRLGAEITLMDPHRVIVKGVSILKPNEMVCPPALRPSINILICMLAAKGKSVLRNSYPIDRGYENLYERLNQLGADIQVFE
ncbi:MAG: UDP-N-acetylglucosamine 1-carboxyvinyltransferase [Candidatus Falkowbacteria bacterium]|nr:UDP-N-acetylglucosamine 1-carboxyvinyltransferase [Candidatus Falkowbacteria bacterium]